MDQVQKKTIFSGIQPSGVLTLGNYLGALVNWRQLQDDYNCYYCVVDLHAITVRQDATDLRKRCLDTLALLMACGLDPDKSVLYFQSHVSAHSELTWVLNCSTYLGELSRMTQFKEKSKRHSENINLGLYSYPVLQAADILLYQTHMVPVGADQKQHLELSRDIAIRFNNAYGETFVVPEAYIPTVGARIMSLQEPDKKMSKSDDNENAYIALTDPPEVIQRKIKRAVTDSNTSVSEAHKSPGVENLLSIYSACERMTLDKAYEAFEGQGYGALKNAVADCAIAALTPIQNDYAKYRADKKYLLEKAQSGAEKAERTARRTLSKVYKRIGLAPA